MVNGVGRGRDVWIGFKLLESQVSQKFDDGGLGLECRRGFCWFKRSQPRYGKVWWKELCRSSSFAAVGAGSRRRRRY